MYVLEGPQLGDRTLGHLGRHARNVDEINPAGHLTGHASVESANLGVNVCQERRASPSSNLHNFISRIVVEAQRHGAGCSQGVGANTGKAVSLCREAGLHRSCAHSNKNVRGNHVDSWTDKAERSGRWHVLTVDRFDSSRQGSHRVEGSVHLMVVDSLAPMAILLVIDGKNDHVCAA